MTAVILNLFKLFGVYITLLAPGYICKTKREDPLQCKYFHRMMHIVVITVMAMKKKKLWIELLGVLLSVSLDCHK